MTITVNLMQELEQSVRRAARRAGVTPDAYVADVLRRHLQAETPMLPASESALLQQINIGLSEREWQRYHQLRNRLADETLTPDEQVELLDLTDRIETANVQRVAALIQLAEIRNTSVDALIDQLGIRPAAYA